MQRESLRTDDRAMSYESGYVPGDEPEYDYPRQGWSINFDTIRGILWRQRFIVVSVIALALVAGLVITLLTRPIYQADATVRIDPYQDQIVPGQEVADPYILGTEINRYLETLATIVRSRSIAMDVVEALNLAEDERILGEMADSPPPAGASEDNWKQRKAEIAASILSASVDVVVPPDSRILTIRYRSTDPLLAARIANGYADAFVMDDVNRAVEQNSYAQEYLRGEIEEMREQLRDAELRANEYARANRIFGQPIQTANAESGTETTPSTVTATNLMRINQAYTDARAERIDAEQRWRAVAGTPAAELPEVRNNPLVQQLQGRRATLISEIADLRQRYQDDYPQLAERRAQLETLNAELATIQREAKSSIRNEYEIALRQEQALQRELSSISDMTLDEQDRRVQHNLLEREAQAYRAQLQMLLERYNQISAALNLTSTNASKLDDAVVPARPISPNLFKNMLLSLFFGVALAAALATLRELLDDRLRSINEVEDKLGVRALGQVPFVEDEIVETLENRFTPASEAYSSIRATLAFALRRHNSKVVQITSSQPSEGKTITAVSLAEKYAALSKRVLVVDFDLRKPAVASTLGMRRPSTGIDDVLFGRATLENAVQKNVRENLDVLSVTDIPDNPIEILSSGLVAEMLENARSQYDVIVLDSSPVMGIADAPLLSRYADAVLFVVEANATRTGQARHALRRLFSVGANVIGVVVTKYRALQAGQDYSYQYKYYQYEAKSN